MGQHTTAKMLDYQLVNNFGMVCIKLNYVNELRYINCCRSLTMKEINRKKLNRKTQI